MLFDDERPAFSDLLDEIGEHYGRTVSGATKLTWWRLLAAQLDLDTLRILLDRHLLDAERGRFFPQPADLVALLERTRDGRPSADEAWALALESFDEAATVCVTDEILGALRAAAPVWSAGDRIGARLAFKAAYERAVAEPRRQGRRPRWQLSLGWDAERRQVAAQQAVASGRLSADAVHHLLPAPLTVAREGQAVKRLAGPAGSLPRDPDAETHQRLRALRELIQRSTERPGTAQAERAALRRERMTRHKRQALTALEQRRARQPVR
ncbi:hypothetical protein [Thiorhodococcus minor]|uniref:Uncharacterized protein n=1 Tax=Thiorhodococcus minor TaxID=57489 RepID=A0A6M0K638_9GAMM|nr:hypothetical protein [Thiorhodococcus minor]NEV64714.1 hypothetical protein [Thiorhodococcus minor]